MSRLPSLLLFASCIAAQLQAQDDRDRDLKVSTYWNVNQTTAEVGQLANGGWRVTDLEIESTSPMSFTVSAVQNTGTYQKNWYWYAGVTGAQLSTSLAQTNSRIVDIEPYDDNGTTRFAAVLVGNTGAEAKAWWWGYDMTQAQVNASVQANNARIVDLERYTKNGATLFAVSMISNTGSDLRSWGYLYGVPLSTVLSTMSGGNRIYNLERVAADSYDVVFLQNTGFNHWIYVDQSASQVTEILMQNVGRAIDIERRITLLGTRYDVVMIDNANALEKRVRNVYAATPAASLGDYGFFLKEVNGPVLAEMRADTTFEPASTMKTLYHVHAMKAVANGTATLSQMINKPLDCGVPGSQLPMETVLSQMMQQSDNLSTLAISNHFGIPAIQATANSLGMTSTALNWTIGCNGPTTHNTLTLRDLSRLHEQVANGYLGTQRQNFYSLMLQSESLPTWGTSDLHARINAEASVLGLSSAVVTAFKNALQLAYKPGGIGWQTSAEMDFYFAEGGWMSVPFRGTNGQDLTKEFTFGVFNYNFRGAANEFAGREGMGDAELELIWDRIKPALATWVHYTPGATALAGTGGCPGSIGAPWHTIEGVTEIGQAAQYRATSLPNPTLAIAMFGFQNSSYNGVALPANLTSIGAPGCTLYTAPEITFSLFSNNGTAVANINFPQDQALIGALMNSQFLVLDPTANQLGWTTSNARYTRIGGWR